MAGNTIGEAWIAIRPATGAFESELHSGLKGGLAAVAKDFEAIGAAAIGVGALAVKAFSDQQTATVLLNQSLKDASQKWTPALGAALTKTDNQLLGFGQTSADVSTSLSRLVTAGVPAADAIAHMSQIADLAAKMHISLADATTLVIQGTEGMGRGLKQLGIIVPPVIATSKQLQTAQATLAKDQAAYTAILDKHGHTVAQVAAAHQKLIDAQDKVTADLKSIKDPMANFDSLMGSVGSKTAGTAAALGTTLAGSLGILGATVTDKVLVPLGAFINQGLVVVVTWVTQHVVPALIALEGVFMQKVVPAIGQAYHWFAVNLLPTIKQIAGWVMTQLIPSFTNFITKGIIPLAGWVMTQLIPSFTNFITKGIIPLIGGIANLVKPLVKDLWPIIVNIANWFTKQFIPALGNLVTSFNQHVVPALKPVVDLLGNTATGLLGIIVPIGEFLVKTLLGALKTLSDNFSALEAPLGGVVASFVIWKGVAVGGAVISMVQGLISLAPGLLFFAAASAAALWPWLALAAAASAILLVIKAIEGITATPKQAAAALKNAGLNRGTGVFNPPGIPTGKASGGPAMAGMDYLVGEKGPELLRMGSTSGTVIPNHALSGGGGVTQINNFYGVGRETIELVDQRIQRNNRALILAKRAH